MANVRRNKNYIRALSSDNETTITQSDKHRLILEYYKKHIVSCSQRNYSLNFEALGWQPQQLQSKFRGPGMAATTALV
jgi:hypothetical protein